LSKVAQSIHIHPPSDPIAVLFQDFGDPVPAPLQSSIGHQLHLRMATRWRAGKYVDGLGQGELQQTWINDPTSNSFFQMLCWLALGGAVIVK